MSRTALFPGVLVSALCSCCLAKGQSPQPAAGQGAPLPRAPVLTAPVAPAVPPGTRVVASAVPPGAACEGGCLPGPYGWAGGPDCHGPVGGNGPVGWEVYLRSGVSLPFGGGALTSRLDPGWIIQGGARSLFFNSFQDA